MNDAAYSTWPSTAAMICWSARILSALILLFWGFFIVGHLVGDAGSSSRPLETRDYVSLTTMILSLVGLGVAWRWESVGGCLTLAAVLIGAVANWRVLVFPGTLIPVAACLFLIHWWMNRMPRLTPLP